MSIEKLPTSEQVAACFTNVIREWLTPEQIHKVNQRNKADGYTDATCATGDYCDSNMAMDRALTDLGVEIFEPIPNTDDHQMKDSVLDLWHKAWAIAKKNDYRRELKSTDFGTYAFEKDGIEITGFLTSENSIDQYDPNTVIGSGEKSIPQRYGFHVVETGGGHTAWWQDFILNGKRVHMMLTDEGGMTHKIDAQDRLLVGIYADDDETEEAIIYWEQDNFPLDSEQNLPTISSSDWSPHQQLPIQK
jgi:hypothetical protein